MAIIAYKALLAGSMAVKVDAYYTSQACPRVGIHRAETALTRDCCLSVRAAIYVLHADLVGARNIALQNAARSARLGEHGRLVRTP